MAIISVVAYQNFWWAVDKAVSGRKISDVSTIETSLVQFKSSNNFYPPVWEFDANNNLWWYSWATVASKSNKLVVTYNWQEINTISQSNGWWKVFWWWSLWQIWAKWTIWKEQLWQYLTKDLYDPEIWDLKVNNIWAWTQWKMIDKWVGRYVYAVYKKSFSWPANQNWTSYNIAFTIKKEGDQEWFVTKIVWDYDKNNYGSSTDYPDTLIWTLSWTTTPWVLLDWSQQIWSSNSNDYWVPYAVTDFAQ